MSTNNPHKTQVEKAHLEELLNKGVGGKYKNDSDYLEKIAQEIEWEEQMVRGGIERYNNTIKKAVEKGTESTTKAGLNSTQKYVPIISKLIHTDIKNCFQGEAGRHQTCFKLLLQCLSQKDFLEDKEFVKDDPFIWATVSLIAIKNILDGISKLVTVNALAIDIGTSLELEARLTLFKDVLPEKHKQLESKINTRANKMSKNKRRYKQKVWVYFMNKNNLFWSEWSKADKLHLGCKIVEYFEREGLITHEDRKKLGYKKRRSILYVCPTEKLTQEIRNFNIHNEALIPKFMPMLMPPMSWSSPYSGGYYAKKYNYQNKPKDIFNALQFRKRNK